MTFPVPISRTKLLCKLLTKRGDAIVSGTQSKAAIFSTPKVGHNMDDKILAGPSFSDSFTKELSSEDLTAPSQETSLGMSRLQTHMSPEVTSSYKAHHRYARKAVNVLLPNLFEPQRHSVVLGRGRRAAESPGSRRLAMICRILLPRYSKAAQKHEKTAVVTEIYNMIQRSCDDPKHGFVRLIKGKWHSACELQGRERIGAVFRDLLSDRYRSSGKNKVAKKRKLKFEAALLKDPACLPQSDQCFALSLKDLHPIPTLGRSSSTYSMVSDTSSDQASCTYVEHTQEKNDPPCSDIEVYEFLEPLLSG